MAVAQAYLETVEARKRNDRENQQETKGAANVVRVHERNDGAPLSASLAPALAHAFPHAVALQQIADGRRRVGRVELCQMGLFMRGRLPASPYSCPIGRYSDRGGEVLVPLPRNVAAECSTGGSGANAGYRPARCREPPVFSSWLRCWSRGGLHKLEPVHAMTELELPAACTHCTGGSGAAWCARH